MQVRVFDIDETLCDDGSVLCDGTLAALMSLKKKGEGIHFASARHWITTKEALRTEALHSKDVLVATENGGRIFMNGQLIEQTGFTPDEKALISDEVLKLRDRVQLLDYWSEDALYTVSENIPVGTSDDLHREYVTLERAIDDICHKAICMVHFVLESTDGTQPSEGHWMPKGISKANIYAHLQNADRILVYGNGDNDMQLFSEPIRQERIAYAIGPNPRLRAVAQKHLQTRQNLLELLTREAQI